MSENLTEEQKAAKIKEMDEKQKKQLAETDPSYAEHLKLNAKANLSNPEERELVKALIAKKEQKQDSLADKKIQVYKEFGDEKALDATSTEELKNFVTQKVKDAAEKSRGIPSGSALVDAQFGRRPDDLYTHKFENYGELIKELRERAKTSREAQSYLDSITEIALRTMKDPNQRIPFYNPNDPVNLPPLKDEGGFKVPVKKEQGDIGKLIERFANENPRRKRAKEQIEAGANPAQRE
jgi:hypothetical protein